MGFRFRKTVRLGGLVRLNFSGSGVSLGLGPRGANINISKRGLRKTVGIPGSGLSYSTFRKWPDAPPPASRATLPPPAGDQQTLPPGFVAQGRKSAGVLKFMGVVGVLSVLYSIFSQPDPRTTASATYTAAPAATTLSATAGSRAPATMQTAQPAAQPVTAPAAPPPTANSAPLSMEEIRELQTRLKAFGLNPGPVDGFLGPLTAAAIKRYEAGRAPPATGTADRQLLERLRKDAGGAVR